MQAFTFEEARALVLEKVLVPLGVPTERCSLLEAAGRVLAESVLADRDYPPAAKSMRDGFAVRSADVPGTLRVVGETRAGEAPYGLELQAGEAVEIMTGALMPAGADQVVMVEHVRRHEDRLETEVAGASGSNFNVGGSEAREGAVLLRAGRRIGFADVSLMAAVGLEDVLVYRKPRVAILATGDEVMELGAPVEPWQVRNSNSYSLAVQVREAGGEPEILPVAKDDLESTRVLLERASQASLVLISGGVSAGKHDVVEEALAELGAEFHFTRVKIQPGQPAVFGHLGQTVFFGLPGNPGSTMVTFLIFAKAALERLAGIEDPQLPLLYAQVAEEFQVKAGLTRFLPAVLGANGGEVRVLPWRGSSDVPAIAKGNCYAVTDREKQEWKKGDWIRVLLRG